jgi:ERCC4-type nuclease
MRRRPSGGIHHEAKVNSAPNDQPCIHLNDHPIDIVADDRERAAEVVAFLGAIPGVSVRSERLASGDYLADRRILFERKTLQDLARSIVDGRLFK